MFSSVYAIKALIQKNKEGMGWNYSVIIVPSQVVAPKTKTHYLSRGFPKNAKTWDYEDYRSDRAKRAKTVYGMIETEAHTKRCQGNYAIACEQQQRNFSPPKTKKNQFRAVDILTNTKVKTSSPISSWLPLAKEHFGDRDPNQYL
jgi:hypothetical protein